MSKVITITGAETQTDNRKDPTNFRRITSVEMSGPDSMEASDGSHTFSELYDHRAALFLALCRAIQQWEEQEADDGFNLSPSRVPRPLTRVWRSKRHCDGIAAFDGWFIAGIGVNPGRQITYHLPVALWDECGFFETLDRAPEWDGHTPASVVSRLNELFAPKVDKKIT